MKQKQLDRLIRSIEEWNGWRSGQRDDSERTSRTIRDTDFKIDLSYADLQNLNLGNADLSGANLSCAIVCGSDMSGCDLRGAELQFIEYNAQTKWPSHVQLPDNARRKENVTSGGGTGSTVPVAALQPSNEDGSEAHLNGALVEVFAVCEMVRLALPERPNDRDTQEILAINKLLLDTIKDLQERLEKKQSTIDALQLELDTAKAEANRSLNRFLRRTSDSVADQVGPTIKWMFTAGGAVVAAEAMKAVISP
ncbi:MAG: pentapeptide repeat-containing protein [Pseudomonadota bacterium]